MTKPKYPNRVFIEHYGIAYNVYELSNQLVDLNVGHVYPAEGRWALLKQESIEKQPALPVLLPSLDAYLTLHKNSRRLPEINLPMIAFVFAPVSVLKCTNLNLFALTSSWSVKQALVNASSKIKPAPSPKVEIPTVEQFIKKEAKPSLMHEFQTAIYKVKPGLRVEARKLIIQLFRGEIAANKVMKFLNSDPSLAPILTWLGNPKARDLAQAIYEARTTTVQTASKKYDLDVFDLNYILNRAPG